MEIPILSPKVVRNYGTLDTLDVDSLPIDPLPLKTFSEEENGASCFEILRRMRSLISLSWRVALLITGMWSGFSRK